jgi:hypothetical protein
VTFGRTVRIVAATAIGAAAAIFAVGGVAPAEAAPPTHVGLVIAGEGSWCETWHAGMSGIDLLNEAGVKVTADPRQGGLITGLGDISEPDSSKSYWAFYDTENADGSWHYSNVGAGGSRPAAGAVQGWAVSPTNGADVYPPAVSYASICGAQDAPVAPPAPATAAHPIATSKAVAAPAPNPPVAIATPNGVPASSGSVDAATAGAASTTNASVSGASSRSISTRATAPVASTSVSLAAGSSRSGSSSGSPLPLIIGGSLVAALLAGGGVVAWQRRRSSSP